MSFARTLAAVILLTLIASPAWATSLTNGDFSAGLAGWTTENAVSNGGGFALLQENPTLILTSLSQAFVVPAGAYELSFHYAMTSVTGTPTGSLTPDAFTATLYQVNGPTLTPLISTAPFDDFFYADSAGFKDYGLAIELAAGTVTAYLPSLGADTNVLLEFDLLGSANGLRTQVALDDVRLSGGAVAQVPEPITATGLCLAGLAIGAYARRRRS
jgi:hypothetical protein